MVISSDAVFGHLPSLYPGTLDGESSVIQSSNPSESSCLPSRSIPPSNFDALSSFFTASSSDNTLDGHWLSEHAQVRGNSCFSLELSNSNGIFSSAAKPVSTVPDGNCYDPMSNIEEQLIEDGFQSHGQDLDDRPIDSVDEPLATSRVDSTETPDDSQDDEDDGKSAMEYGPEESPSRLPVSSEYPRTAFYRPCMCNRYGRLYRPGRWNSPCGPKCQFYPRVTDSWDPFRNRWGYGRDDRPLSFSLLAETGVGAGLYNLGNTCFLNVILQCFTHTVPLVKALRSSNHLMPCQRGFEGFCVACALRNHIELSLASSGKTISPSQVVDNLNKISSCFHKNQQEDAHEFLQCILDKLERCLNSTLNEDTLSSQDQDDNIVQRVFGGRLVSKLRCCNCGHCSDKHEPLIDLSLEIEDADTLQNALESFTKVERIDDSEAKLKCDSCKEEVSMEKQLMLDRAPSVCALHLKRFKTDGSFIEKIRKPVDFPLLLDLEPYINGSNDSYDAQEHSKYQLYGVVVHDGFSPTSGHYFCYVRSSPSIWHKLDDSMVVRVKEEMVLSEAAYILFYVREDAPWFSSLMETHKDPNTSPKSVLETVESDCTAYPLAENSDICKANVNTGYIERTPFRCVLALEDNKMNQIGINTAQISCASKNPEAKLCYDKSSDDFPMNDAYFNEDKSGALPSHKINSVQIVHGIQRTDAMDPLVPPSSPNPESRHKIRRDDPVVENAINEMKVKKGNRDVKARKEAVRYIHKNVASARAKMLLAAMGPRNDKRKRLRSSPCKQGSHPGYRSKMIDRLQAFR